MSALAVRTSLLVDALAAPALAAAAGSAADAVVIDAASAAAYARRADARRGGNHALLAIAETGRPVHARVSDLRSGETEGDVMSLVRAGLTAVVLSSVERPQDVRDLDVMVRKQEMRRGIEPGSVRLVTEIDSAEGLRALDRILAAVDRHSAVSLNVSGLAASMRLPGTSASHLTLIEHAMAEVALTCAARSLAWTVAAPTADPGSRAEVANRAWAMGASGVTVASEAEAGGFTRLFTPRPEDLEAARAVIAGWETISTTESQSGVLDGILIDRRALRHARTAAATAAAIEARERLR